MSSFYDYDDMKCETQTLKYKMPHMHKILEQLRMNKILTL